MNRGRSNKRKASESAAALAVKMSSTGDSSAAGVNERFFKSQMCLQQVFACLEMRRRVMAERVSKRVRTVFLQCWKSVKMFDAYMSFLFSPFFGDEEDKSQEGKGTLEICARIGSSLRFLVLDGGSLDKYSKHFRAIAKTCPKVEQICLIGYRCCFGVPPPFDAFTTLKVINFACARYQVSGQSAALFRNLPPSLEVVVGFPIIDLDAESFFRQHPNLERFEVRFGVFNGTLQKIFPLIAECPKLKNLMLPRSALSVSGIEQLSAMIAINVSAISSRDYDLTDAQVVAICERSPDLEYLAMFGRSRKMTRRSFEAIATLNKLRYLELGPDNPNAPRHDGYSLIAEGCGASLEILALFAATQFTDQALNALGSCQKLSALSYVTEAKPRARFTADGVRSFIEAIVSAPGWNLSAEEAKVVMPVKKKRKADEDKEESAEDEEEEEDLSKRRHLILDIEGVGVKAFKALSDAKMPSGVRASINTWHDGIDLSTEYRNYARSFQLHGRGTCFDDFTR